MAGRHARITDSTNYNQTFSHGAFDHLAQRAFQIGPLKISAGGNVYNSNLIFVLMLKHPFKSADDVRIRNVTRASNFDQYQRRLGCDTAIKTIRQMPVAGGNN